MYRVATDATASLTVTQQNRLENAMLAVFVKNHAVQATNFRSNYDFGSL